MSTVATKIAVKTVILSVLVYIFTLFSMDFVKSGAVLPSVSFSQVINEYNPLDIDGDGMPNIWEETYGLDPNDQSDAVLDPDNDGLSNLNEYLYTTDPTDSDTDGGSLLDGVEVQQGKNPLDPTDDIDPVEEPEETDNEDDNDNDGDNKLDTTGDKSPIQIEVTRLPDNLDLDNDRLTNAEELTLYFTNPYLQDTDYDGLTDYEELFEFYTNPNNFDTDGGGVGDGDELANRTDPKNSTDDIVYKFSSYILNDKASTVQSRQPNKFICVAGEPFTIVFETQLPSSDVQLYINNKEVETLVCPQKGINTLKIAFTIEDRSYAITRRLESLPKGKVLTKYVGRFYKYYDYVPFYNQTLLINMTLQLDILKNNNFIPYISDVYAVNGNIQTNSLGEYFFVALPGEYRYSYKNFNPGFIENTTQGPIVYNKNIVLTKSGDPLFIGLILGYLTLTFALAFSLLTDIVILFRKLGSKKRISC